LPNSAWKAAAGRYEKKDSQKKEAGREGKEKGGRAEKRDKPETAEEKKKREEREKQDRELKEFNARFVATGAPLRVLDIGRVASSAYEQHVQRALAQDAEERQKDAVEKAQATLEKQRAKVGKLLDALQSAGPYTDKTTEGGRVAARGYAKALAELLAASQQRLADKAGGGGREQEALEGKVFAQYRNWLGTLRALDVNIEWSAKDFSEQFLSKEKPTHVSTILGNAFSAYKEHVAEVLDTDVEERKREAVDKAQATLKEQREKVGVVLAALRKAGPYATRTQDDARRVGRDYAQALADLLDTARRGLEPGARWGQREESRLRKQAREVERLRRDWRDLFTR
jgi:hypothetical protein